MKYLPTHRGYVAVVSAIIISAILTELTFADSVTVLWSRLDQLAHENHARARTLANSCIYEALLAYKEDPSAATSTTTAQNNEGVRLTASDSCVIDEIFLVNGILMIFTHAASGGTYAGEKVKIAINPMNGVLSIVSWEESTSSSYTSTPP